MRRSLKTTVTGVFIPAVLAGLDARQWRAHVERRTAFGQQTIKGGDFYMIIKATDTLEREEVI